MPPACTTDLTDRERQIAGLIARGAGTADIAGALFLSAHTVRDYVKATSRHRERDGVVAVFGGGENEVNSVQDAAAVAS